MDPVQELEKFLTDNSFVELINICKANGVDSITTLKEIIREPNEYKECVPQLGQRIKLKSKLLLFENSHQEQANNNIIIHDYDTDHYVEESEPPNKIYIVDINNQSTAGSSYIEENDESGSTSTSLKASSGTISTESTLNDFNLSELLEKTSMGRAIKELYKLKHCLSSKCQSYLVEIVVQHFINAVPFRRLTNEDFRNIAKLIVQEFPKELPQVYFTSPIKKRNSRDKRSGIARGKLVDKFRNRLTFLREAGILSSSRCPSELNEDHDIAENIEEGEDVHQEDIIWLKNNQEPWSDVIDKWNCTYDHRQKLLNQDVDFQEFLNVFPIIQNSLGHSLIDLDFKKRYPCHNELYKNFEPVIFKLLELKEQKLNQSDALVVEIINSSISTDNESRHYLMLTLLPALLPTRTYNKKGKNTWFPTSTETVSGLVVHVRIPGDISNVIEEKRKKLSKYNLPLLPFIIIEGASYSEINNIYVSYDNILYKVVSVLKALDVCFQFIHLFNLKYPYECEHVWMFIQLGMYHMKTIYDKIPNILDIANKINSST